MMPSTAPQPADSMADLQAPTESRRRRALLGLLLLAGAIRIGFCAAQTGLGSAPPVDYREYILAGQRLITHGTLVSSLILADSNLEPSALFPPAYAGLVAGVYAWLGTETVRATMALQFINIFAVTAVVGLVYSITRSVAGPRTAWLAAIIAALNPVGFGFVHLVWDTSLYTLGVALSVWSACWMGRRVRGVPLWVAFGMWLGLGLWLGLLALLNPALTAAYPLLVLWPLSTNWSSAVSRKVGWLASSVSKGGLSGVVRAEKNLPQPLLAKEGGRNSNDLPGLGAGNPIKRPAENVTAQDAAQIASGGHRFPAKGLALDSLRFRRSVVLILAAVLGWGLAITPWVVRNYVHFGRFIYVRSGFMEELWLGVCPEADVNVGSAFRGQFPLKNEDVQRHIQDVGEAVFLEECAVSAKRTIRDDPARYLRLVAIRFVDYWLGTVYTRSAGGGWALSPMRLVLAVGLTLQTAVILVWLVVVRSPGRDARWILAIAASFCVVYCITHVQLRFRAPMEPIMSILVAIALRDLIRVADRLGLGGCIRRVMTREPRP